MGGSTPTHIGLKGSFLSVTRQCSGWGSGSPLTRTFAGSKPLLSRSFTFLTHFLLTTPYPRRRWVAALCIGGGQPRAKVNYLCPPVAGALVPRPPYRGPRSAIKLNNRIATQILSENITQRDKKGKGEACQDAGVSIIVVCYVLPISLLLPGRNSV